MTRLTAAVLMLLTLSLSPVQAEVDESFDGTDSVTAPATKPKPRPRPKPKAAPKPVVKAPVLPSAPIPYLSLKPDMPPVAGAPIAPKAPVILAATVDEPPPPPPPPPPSVAARIDTPAPPVYVIPARTHDLKCETQVVDKNVMVSKGTFYLEVTLSEVFPDEAARFKVMFADPRHLSLVKDTVCETISCQVRISPNFYDLYNQRTKKGAALRVTLDRHTGAFLAQKIDGKSLLGRIDFKPETDTFEQGYCRPQSRPDKLF